jgi:hypothetical protein
MTSWRDHASPQAQNDLDGLLEPALGFAQQQLAENGEFFPYAVVVGVDGHIEMVAARPNPTDDQPASADVITACRTSLAERRDQLRATAVVADVRIPDHGGEAIQVELEHTEGPVLTVLLPYNRKRFSKTINYGQLRAATADRHIWGA